MSDDRDEMKAAPGPGGKPVVGSLPVTWSNGSQQVAGKRALVMAPTAEEQSRFAAPRAHTCAECKSFDLQAGQRAMEKERFAERLVLEMQWKTKYLGAPITSMGFCGQTKNTLTSAYASSCEHFRPANGRVRGIP